MYLYHDINTQHFGGNRSTRNDISLLTLLCISESQGLEGMGVAAYADELSLSVHSVRNQSTVPPLLSIAETSYS